MNVLIYLGMLVACCVYALIRGGTPERVGVGVLLAAVLMTIVLPPAPGRVHYQHIEWGALLIDGTMLVAVTVLALRANRYWPMWMAGILLSTVVTHLLMLAPTVMPVSYSLMIAVWSYPNPLLLAVGTARHRQRVRLYGEDPAW